MRPVSTASSGPCCRPRWGGAFVLDMAAFANRLAPTGAVNSLTQVALKLTVPGVPDIYQGTDLWDFSLVDPDNRRPVDFAARARMLADGHDPADLLADWRDGRIKQALTARLLDLRRRHPTLFSHGAYVPMEATGEQNQSVVAFARVAPAPGETGAPQALVVVAPRLVWPLMGDSAAPLPPAKAWGDTALRLPAEADWASAPARDTLTGRALAPDRDGTLPLSGLLDRLPVAVLTFGDGA